MNTAFGVYDLTLRTKSEAHLLIPSFRLIPQHGFFSAKYPSISQSPLFGRVDTGDGLQQHSSGGIGMGMNLQVTLQSKIRNGVGTAAVA